MLATESNYIQFFCKIVRRRFKTKPICRCFLQSGRDFTLNLTCPLTTTDLGSNFIPLSNAVLSLPRQKDNLICNSKV